MINTTTATQRRDRRRELEEKYGLRSTTNNKVQREDNLTEVISGIDQNMSFEKEFDLFCFAFVETRQLKSSSSSDEPLIALNANLNQPSTSLNSSRRAAPPTNIFNDV